MKEYSADEYDLAFTFTMSGEEIPKPEGTGWMLFDTKVGGAGNDKNFAVFAFFFWARKK